MNLKRQFITGIENFAKDRKTISGSGSGIAKDFPRTFFRGPAQGFTGEFSVGDNAFIIRAIRNFPGFTYRFAIRQIFFEKLFQFASAPDALLKNRLENEWVKHVIRRLRAGLRQLQL